MTEQINNTPQNTPPESKIPSASIDGSITIKNKEYSYEDIKRLAGIMGKQGRLAGILNCTKQYISYLKDQDPKFALAIDEGKDKADGEVIFALHENAVKYKDTNAQKYYLSNHLKEEYADRSKVEQTVRNIDEVVKEIENTYEIPKPPITNVTVSGNTP